MVVKKGDQLFIENGNYIYMEFLNSLISLLLSFAIFRNYLRNLRKTIVSYRETEWHHTWYLSLLMHLSHNLRTPLAGVLTNMEILSTKLKEEPNARRIIQRIVESGLKLKNMVTSVVEASNKNLITSEGKTIYQVTDSVVSKRNENIHFSSLNNEAVLIKGPEIVSLALALDVIIGNALRYGAPPIKIRVENNILYISDQGKGLEAGLIEELIAESENNNATGYGNSLKFVFTLLRESGWHISIDTEAQGASFIIRRGIQNWAEKAIS
jgi:K+-sensing histidine kinase KdpD